MRLRHFSAALLMSAMTVSPVFAEDEGGIDKAALDALMERIQAQQEQLAQQQEQLKEQAQLLEQQRIELQRQRGQFMQLQDQVISISDAEAAKKLEKKYQPAAGQKKAATPAKKVAKKKNGAPTEVGTSRKEKAEDRPTQDLAVLADEGGVLSRKGRLTIEPSLEYSRSSALRVAIEGFTIIPALNVGSFEITQVDRDTITSAVAARYGLTNRLEIDAKVPFVYRSDNTLSRPIGAGAGVDTLQELDGSGLGDIEVGAHYQVNDGREGWPFFVGNLRFKSATGTDPFEVPIDPVTGLQAELPTGSGFYALQPSVTMIYPSDPAVYFANLGYLYNMERDIGGVYGTIDPGDSVSFSFGMGFAINERTSYSLSYSHSTVFKTLQNGVAVPNSDVLQVGALDLGYSFRLNEMTNLNFNVSAGLTEDAPDVRLTFRVPISFNLLK